MATNVMFGSRRLYDYDLIEKQCMHGITRVTIFSCCVLNYLDPKANMRLASDSPQLYNVLICKYLCDLDL